MPLLRMTPFANGQNQMASCHKYEMVISHASSTQLSVLIQFFRRQLAFCLFAWDLGMTLESIRERSQSRLKLIKEQFWYKSLCYELINSTIKISLWNYLPLERIQNYTQVHPLFKSLNMRTNREGEVFLHGYWYHTPHKILPNIYVCRMCVCVYIYTHVYICVYVYVHTHAHTCTHTHAHAHAHTHTHTHIHTHTDRGREVFLHGVLVLQAARNTSQTTAPLQT